MAAKTGQKAPASKRAKAPRPQKAAPDAKVGSSEPVQAVEPTAGASRAPARAAKRAAASGESKGTRVKVTLVRSTIGFNEKQATVVRGLGLRGLHHTVDVIDTPAIRGMIHKVRHLVEVE
jgi:large subunit ribosomal protein L30